MSNTLIQEMSLAIQSRFDDQDNFIKLSKAEELELLNTLVEEQTADITRNKEERVYDLTEFEEEEKNVFSAASNAMNSTITAIIGESDDSIVNTLKDLKEFIQSNEAQIAADLQKAKEDLNSRRNKASLDYGTEADFTAGVGGPMTSEPVGDYS